MASRTRSFQGVFYPESAPADWPSVVEGWHVPALVVLHDQDEDLKPHFHLQLIFESLKSLAQARELMNELGSSTVQPVHHIKAAARYLCHLDNPEKFQYPLEDVRAFSGAQVHELMALSGDPSREIMAKIRDQGWEEYHSVVEYCLDERIDWWPWVRANATFLVSYLRSVRHGYYR